MNAQQLRNSILQEAIEGRLVPQDPNDEPASTLLQRIRAEKERLVKEGKLKKKDLEEKPISEDEIPFEIPESWEWVRLKYIVSVLGDGIHGTPQYDMAGNYYFINGNNLSNKKIVIKSNTGKVNENEYQKYKKELNDKTILVSINGTIGNIGHYNGEPIILGKSACYFNLMDIRLKDYVTLLMYTDYFLKYAKENATGSTIKNVSLAVMNDFILPLPPLAEQQRIVAKIEELLPKVEEYGKAQEKLNKLNEELPEKLKKSILQEAIEGRLVPQDPNDEPASALLAKIREEKKQLVKEGKLKKKDLEEKSISEDEIPFSIPDSWEWCRVSSVISLLSGRDLAPQEYNDNNAGIPYITGASNFEDGNLLINRWTTKPITISKKGDLLITCKGTIGTMAYNVIGDIHIARQVMAISSSYINLDFIKYFMMRQVYELERKAKSIIPGISREDVLEALFPLPPFAEQKRIVEKIEQLFKEIDKLKK